MKQMLLLFLLLLSASGWAQTTRYQSLLNARHLTIATKQGSTYYYIVSSQKKPVLHLGDGRVVVKRDTFSVADITGMRMAPFTRFLLDEDSTTFGKDYAVSHAMLVLRRSLVAGQWNSIVLPVALTGEQILEAFGEDALVAQVRGFRQDDNTVVEYETLNLDTDEVAMLPNTHYIIKPSKEPDLKAGATGPSVGDAKPQGPLYMIPNVTMEKGQKPSVSFVRSEDGESRLMQSGTYTIKDGSSSSNNMVAAGVYLLDEGSVRKTEEKTAVKAFSSWYSDISPEKKPLQFYIDGVNEDISTHIFGMTATETMTTGTYDLQGRQMQSSTLNSQLKKGLYIVNGKKVFIK